MSRLGNLKFYTSGRKVHIKGKGVTDILLDGGKGGQNSYASVDDMKQTVNGGSLTADALKRLQALRPKAEIALKRSNIRFSV